MEKFRGIEEVLIKNGRMETAEEVALKIDSTCANKCCVFETCVREGEGVKKGLKFAYVLNGRSLTCNKNM